METLKKFIDPKEKHFWANIFAAVLLSGATADTSVEFLSGIFVIAAIVMIVMAIIARTKNKRRIAAIQAVNYFPTKIIKGYLEVDQKNRKWKSPVKRIPFTATPKL